MTHLWSATPRSATTIVIAVALIALAAPPLAAQTPATGVVTGRITVRADTGAGTAPASGATVSIPGTPLGATTNADGRFTVDRVPAGAHMVRARLLGFRGVERAIRVRAGDTVRVDVTLLSEAQRLSTVRSDARSEEIETFVSKPNVATVTLGAAAMAGVPSVGEPDVVRVVMLLPGVTARNDFNSGLIVRGGEADQNMVLLDGHPIYNPFHLGGLFSTFMDATVGGIELMTGAFPARFGGRLSSVLDVRSAVDVRAGFHATADVSALAASGRIGGAFNGGRGTWSLAGRRTYADAVASAFTKNVFPYHFRDFHGRATYALPNNWRLGLTGYLGRDALDLDFAEAENDSSASRASEGAWAFDWGNQVLGVNVAKDFGTRTTIEQRVSTSGFSTKLNVGDGAFGQRSEIRDLRIGGSLLTRTTAHDVSVGYDVATHDIRYASASAQTGTTEFDLRQKPTFAAAWVADLWRVSSTLLLEGGVRGEALDTRDWKALSPRVSVKYLATPDFAVTLAAGRVTQWLQSLASDGPLRYFDIWIASDEYAPVSTAWHYVAGAEKRTAWGSVRAEGYLKRYDRVLEMNMSEDPSRRGDEFFVAEGSSYGADVLARWQAKRVSGWVAYSYGVSSRERDGLRWSPAHDRRHDIDAVAVWQLAKYRLGGRVGFATGSPYTPIEGEIARRVYDPSRDRWGTGSPQLFVEPLGGARNSARFPAEHRVDLDASREFKVGSATLAPYLSVANVYNAKNVFVYLYEYSTGKPTRRAISQFPILPSVGVRVAF